MEPTYRLEGVIHSKEDMEDFEGPLNLILMLLSKNKIEIRDIQVSLILEQYLAYLAEMEAMDLEIASEFVQMASHLLYIKTKMLLSTQEEVTELELLMSSLEQLKAKDIFSSVKAVLPELDSAARVGALLHVKAPEPQKGIKEYNYSHESYELLKALSNVFSRANSPDDTPEENIRRRPLVPQRIIYNVRDKSLEIVERFRTADRIYLSQLYDESRSRSELVATFISILELCSSGSVSMTVENDNIVLSFVGKSLEDVLDNISE